MTLEGDCDIIGFGELMYFQKNYWSTPWQDIEKFFRDHIIP